MLDISIRAYYSWDSSGQTCPPHSRTSLLLQAESILNSSLNIQLLVLSFRCPFFHSRTASEIQRQHLLLLKKKKQQIGTWLILKRKTKKKCLDLIMKEYAYDIYHISQIWSARPLARYPSCRSRIHQSPQRSRNEHAVGNTQVHRTIHWELGFWWDSTEVCSRPSIPNNLKLNIKSLVIKLTDDKDLQSSQVQLVNKADLNPECLRIAESKLKYLRICNTPVNGSALEIADSEKNVKDF